MARKLLVVSMPDDKLEINLAGLLFFFFIYGNFNAVSIWVGQIAMHRLLVKAFPRKQQKDKINTKQKIDNKRNHVHVAYPIGVPDPTFTE